MEIEEFIEQDILVFLDKLLDKEVEKQSPREGFQVSSVYLTRDYEEELLASLHEGNLVKAKRVLHDLREKFDEIPESTLDKQQVKALLADLYEKFREYIDSEYGKVPHKQKPQHEAIPPAPPKELQVSTPAEEPSKENEEFLRSAEKHLDLAEVRYEERDFKEAVQEYRSAKRAALHIESGVSEDLAKRFTEIFGKIKHAIHGLERLPTIEKEQETPEATPEANESRMFDHQLLVSLEQEKNILDQQLHSGAVADGMKTYNQMKILVSHITDNAQAEIAAEKLVRIYEIIKSLGEEPTREENLARSVP